MTYNAVEQFCVNYENARIVQGGVSNNVYSKMLNKLHEAVGSTGLWFYFFNGKMISGVSTIATLQNGKFTSIANGVKQGLEACPELIIKIPDEWWRSLDVNSLEAISFYSDTEEIKYLCESWRIMNSLSRT